MDNKRDIDEELRYGAKIISQLSACNKTLRDGQLKQTNCFELKSKEWDRERKGWERERRHLERNSIQNSNETQKLRTHALEVINEVKRLQIENTHLTSQLSHEQISHTEYENK